MPKPKWEDAPDWAKWLAQDYYGDWYWYAHKPKISDSSAMWQAYIGFSLTGFWEDHRIMHYSQYYKDSQKHDEYTGKFITYSKLAGYTPPEYPYNDNWKNTLEKRPKKGESKMFIITKEVRDLIIDAFECLDETFKYADTETLNIGPWFQRNWKHVCEKTSYGKYKKLPNWKKMLTDAPTDLAAIRASNSARARKSRAIEKQKHIVSELPDIFTTNMLANKLGKTKVGGGSLRIFYQSFNDLNIERLSHGVYRKINRKENTMPKSKDIISTDHIPTLSEDKTEIAYLPRILAEFKALPNADKLDFIKALIPMLPDNQLSDAYAERYPDYLFRDLKDGDKLFHPIAGDIEVANVNAHKFHFYGNGTKWESDRNGYLIVNGKKDAKRTIFLNLDDYVKHMKKQG